MVLVEVLEGINTNNTTLYTNFYPTIWYVADHDDNTAANVAVLQSYTYCKHTVLRPNCEISFYVVPTTLTQIGSSINGTGAAVGQSVNFNKTWINCTNSGVPHYGIKFAIDFEGQSPPSGAKWYFQIQARYLFS